MLCEALRRWGDKRPVTLLIDLLDEDWPGHVAQAIRALGNLRAIGARDAVARFVESRNTMPRNEAKRALKKIDV